LFTLLEMQIALNDGPSQWLAGGCMFS
jgi:hypothetical protein